MALSRRGFLGGAVGAVGLLLGLRTLKQTMWVSDIDLQQQWYPHDIPIIDRNNLSRHSLVGVDDWTEMQNRTARDMAKQFRLTMDEFVRDPRTGSLLFAGGNWSEDS